MHNDLIDRGNSRRYAPQEGAAVRRGSADPRAMKGGRMAVHADVTRILAEIAERPDAAGELLPYVYDELRVIARARMREERAGHTLDATALVHEAYMKLVGNEGPGWRCRAQFFHTAAEAMRRILIDHARKRNSLKRGGGKRGLALDVADLGADDSVEELLAVDDALERLEREDARAAEVVRLRYFAGLSVEETAAMLETSDRTVMRDWAYARARMIQLLRPGDEASDD